MGKLLRGIYYLIWANLLVLGVCLVTAVQEIGKTDPGRAAMLTLVFGCVWAVLAILIVLLGKLKP